MNINDKQDRLIKEFAPLNGWLAKYEYLIDIGQQLPKMEDKCKTAENQIYGCQSQLWVAAELRNGKLVFQADSNTKITRGVIATVLSVINNHTPEDIYQSNLYFLDNIGFKTNLSPSRLNGLSSIIKRINELCLIYMQ